MTLETVRQREVHSARRLYNGGRSKVLRAASWLSLHEPLANRLFDLGGFSLEGRRNILDAGAGLGQLLGSLIRKADEDAVISAVDISEAMLRGLQNRFNDPRVSLLQADISKTPFQDNTFDAIVCGWVLEYFSDPSGCLSEFARILKPDGELLLLVTEHTVFGRVSSKFWKCHTHTRRSLRDVVEKSGLTWKQELFYTRLHRRLKLGGIKVILGKA